MPRRQPISTKQKKAELQLKRAIKRGEASPPPNPQVLRDSGEVSKQQKQSVSTIGKHRLQETSKRLESSFLKVDPGFLEATKFLASVTPLPRPLPSNTAILSESDIVCSSDDHTLFCPKRPKWRYDMSKKEVEANEEGLFRKWLTETDARLSCWRPTEKDISSPSEPTDSNQSYNNNAPIYYERNLQVWRQLWRVTEISHILLVLLDSRCPALHFPPSLQRFLSSLVPTRPLVFVLTKTDIVPESSNSAWTTWLRNKYPNAPVVNVQSYRTIDAAAASDGFLSKTRVKSEPCIRDDVFSRVVSALQSSYEELMTPPEKIQHDPTKLQSWMSTRDFPTNLRWDDVQLQHLHREDKVSEKSLTIGLIGQPNVGKSSLLNALFGTHKVKASRTPGKTKHFQSLFWTSDVRLVDCPGLVFPNFARMELQVLGGILPISQIPSIPACMHYVLQRLPLESILNLKYPSEESSNTSLNTDKRTWRTTQAVPSKQSTTPQWTTMDVLTAFANQKSWVTAKAGRPDINRAGNYILRSLADGRIKWAFWPPGTKDVPMTDDSGIWLGGAMEDEGETGSETAEDVSGEESSDSESRSDDGTSEEEPDILASTGRFQALALDNPQDESD